MPQQYSVYEPRVDSEEIEINGAHAKMAFGFFNEVNQEYVEINPRICTIQLLNGLGSDNFSDSVITETREIALE